MNEQDLEKLRKVMREESDSSVKMLGLGFVYGFIALTIIFLLVGCTAPKPLTDYERHEVAYEEYLAKSGIMGTPHERLQQMWRAVWIEAMIDLELR